MNVKVFSRFVIFLGILFQLWGTSGCLNHGAVMSSSDRWKATRSSGERNFLIGTGIVFLGFAMSIASNKSSKRKSKTHTIDNNNTSQWECACSQLNSFQEKFCPKCGKSNKSFVWKCSCGQVSALISEFCSKCGTQKPLSQ